MVLTIETKGVLLDIIVNHNIKILTINLCVHVAFDEHCEDLGGYSSQLQLFMVGTHIHNINICAKASSQIPHTSSIELSSSPQRYD